MTDRTLDACADSLLECRREVLALKADLAHCYDVCGQAIGSEFRNVGVVEACASFVGTLQADLAAERDKSRAAEVVIELHRKRGQGLLSGMERDSSIRTLKADLASEREARGMIEKVLREQTDAWEGHYKTRAERAEAALEKLLASLTI